MVSENNRKALGVRNALSYVHNIGMFRGFKSKSEYEIFNSSVQLQIMYHCVLKYLDMNNVLLYNNICVHVSNETSPLFPAKTLPSLFLLFYSIYSNENINFAARKPYLFLRHKKGYLIRTI